MLKILTYDFVPVVVVRKVHTYHSRFIPEGVAEASQILLRGPRFTKISCEEYRRRDRW
jgi:hypothetical protein